MALASRFNLAALCQLQSVEAKEGVPLQGDSMTQASITYQCFFNYYDKLAGMTVRLAAWLIPSELFVCSMSCLRIDML